VENGLPSSLVHKSNNICNERNWPLFRQIRFLYFFANYFYRQVENHTKPDIENLNFGGYAMLAKNSHIQQNDPIFSELLDNSFFFPQNKKILTYYKSKQSDDFFSEPF